MTTSTRIFTPWRIGKVTVKNRLVRSATFEFGAEAGRSTERIVALERDLARGGCGLVITGMMAVRHGGGIGPVMVECDHEDFVADTARRAAAVHEHGALFFAQLNHGGFRTCAGPGYDLIGVSDHEAAPGRIYREATPDQIAGMVRAFAEAASRCKAAGCDGVQIHAGHGFLLTTFLSPHYNRRTDAYGGPIAHRARFLFEVCEAVRAAVGPEFPVSVKLPFSDRVEPSITPEECLWTCRELERRGLDMIEVTSGVVYDGSAASFSPFMKKDDPEGTFLAGAVRVAEAVGIPVVSVCGFRTPEFIERTLAETPIAAVSLCRPLIREPDLPRRWQAGERAAAACVSCNRCYGSRGIVACQADRKEEGVKPV